MLERLSRLSLALLASVGLSTAFGAHAQSAGGAPGLSGPAPPNEAKTPDASAGPSQALQDRVVALVQKRRCTDAIAEARKGGDENLAEQVADMCGVKPGSSAKPSGGGGDAGGRGGGGPR